MRFVRKRRLNRENVQHKDCFYFDTLNPHQTFVQEFEDRLDNKDWAYNHTILKMMADLNLVRHMKDIYQVSGTMLTRFPVKFYLILTSHTCL